VAALQGLRAQGDEDPQVLSLVAVHFALPLDPDRLRTGERVGNFTLEEPLGAGGMGVVYRAQQYIGPAQRSVAVKLIHPALLRTAREEAINRFLAELRTLVMLQHAHIARIYDGGIYEDPRTHDQLPYLVMELVRGGLPLTTYARDYALSWPERLALVLRVCRAVQYAHEHRVIHRDLKPANILVDLEGHPFVIDFGLAQACDAVLPGAPLAASGTPAYMSPEQVSGAFGAVSAKSDVYALGLMLYELLTEQLPYVLPRDGAVEELRQVILEAAPPPLRQYHAAYGEELEAIVAAALAKRPAERIPVAVLRSRLERYLQQLPPDSDQPRRPTARHDQDQVGAGSPPLPVQLEPSPALSPAAGTSSWPGAAGSRRPDAERRQLTIMFCDLVDSSQHASHRDPEDWREVVCAYQQTCEKVIQHFDGYIAQWLGDGFLVYFGWPQAHEDDALRAVRTGLGLVEALEPLNTRLAPTHGLHLAVRVGIHTGLVVVGEMEGGGRQERLALGDTPNIASRLQGLAMPDTVVISAATFRLVEGYCTVADLGRQALKGVATPLQVYQVVGASAAQSRLEAAAATGLTPLVGREAEMALLRDRWAQSRDGQGQVVLLCGEAGIGKSRLVEELTTHVCGEGARRMLFRCSSYYTHSAFFPVIAHLQRLLHWDQDEAPAARVLKLEQALRPYGFALQDVVPLFAALLSVPLPERYPPLTLSPQRQKQQTQEALVAWLLAEAEQQPVLAVWEDLHWADPSSLDFLHALIDQTPSVPLLTLLACRPEFDPPWPARSHVTQLTLPRFTRPQIEEMVMHRAGGKRLPAEVLQQIVAKTDGVPLFVEELAKVIVESGLLKATAERYELKGPLPALAIPTTLQDALMARLDRLATAKGLAQLGATIGRQFAYDLLREVAQLDDATVQRELGRLVEAELLYQRGQPPQASYRFKHALIQEAAYQSLLKSTRQQYHRHIAQMLEAQFPSIVETQPELLAHHYTEAGDQEHAVGYWQRAGERALQHSAYLEALQLLSRGLQVLAALPQTLARDHQELALQMALGLALMSTKGQATLEVEQTYARAQELCAHIGETPHLFQTLQGLWRYYSGRGALPTARKIAEQLLRLAQRTAMPALLLEAHGAFGNTLFYLGNYTGALMHQKQGPAFTNPTMQCSHGFHLGQATATGSLANTALTLWCLGYPTQAVQKSQEALALARTLAHPYSMTVVHHWAAYLYHRRREPLAVQTQTDTLLRLATAQGFSLYAGYGTCWQGWVLAMQGEGEGGIAQLHQGLATVTTTGQTLTRPLCLLLLAEARGHVGQVEEGLRLLAEALTGLTASGRGDLLAEVYRLQGAFLLRQSVPDATQAEACFQQALTIARHQQAKSWELRAAMSLSRLWQQQGKQAEARALLTPIYGWFTEGFDTADLQEAKALLAVLT
jgi:serine/threonine protein kinase/predicted ATPase